MYRPPSRRQEFRPGSQRGSRQQGSAQLPPRNTNTDSPFVHSQLQQQPTQQQQQQQSKPFVGTNHTQSTAPQIVQLAPGETLLPDGSILIRGSLRPGLFAQTTLLFFVVR